MSTKFQSTIQEKMRKYMKEEKEKLGVECVMEYGKEEANCKIEIQPQKI